MESTGWKKKIYGRKSHDFRLETVLTMLDRYGAIHRGDNNGGLKVIADLPTALTNQDRLDQKLQRDRQKLYTLVEYANCSEDRKAFIHNYFGLPYPTDSPEPS